MSNLCFDYSRLTGLKSFKINSTRYQFIKSTLEKLPTFKHVRGVRASKYKFPIIVIRTSQNMYTVFLVH